LQSLYVAVLIFEGKRWGLLAWLQAGVVGVSKGYRYKKQRGAYRSQHRFT
jgi:hypothetical protein